MSSNIRQDPSGSIWGLITFSKKPAKINFRDDQSLVSFLDFLYKVLIIFLVNLERSFSDLATLSLARSPAIKARFACFKDCFDRELVRSWLEASLVGLSETHPTLPKRLLAATCILATYNKSDPKDKKIGHLHKTPSKMSSTVYLHKDIDCMGEFRKVMWCNALYFLRFGSSSMLCTRNPLVLGGCLIHY